MQFLYKHEQKINVIEHYIMLPRITQVCYLQDKASLFDVYEKTTAVHILFTTRLMLTYKL